MSYQLTSGPEILRIADNAVIPADERNADYRAYLDWLEAGNTVEPYTPPPSPLPQEVTRFQARTVMRHTPAAEPYGNLFNMAQAWCEAQGGDALHAWEEANALTRNGVLVASFAAHAGMTSVQVDELFRQAALVTV